MHRSQSTEKSNKEDASCSAEQSQHCLLFFKTDTKYLNLWVCACPNLCHILMLRFKGDTYSGFGFKFWAAHFFPEVCQPPISLSKCSNLNMPE